MISPLDDDRGNPEPVEGSARIGVAIATDTARSAVVAKSCFIISFKILAYLDAFAQVTQQPRDPAEHAPFRSGILGGGPQDLVL